MKLKKKMIAFGLTNVFYTFRDTMSEMKTITLEGGNIIPIMSFNTYDGSCRYGKISDFSNKIENITKKKIIYSVEEAEKVEADIMVIAPCSRK